MKVNFIISIIAVSLAAFTACNSNSKTDAENPAATDTPQKPAEASVALPQGLENILGEWNMVKIVADDNGDHVLDADEDKDAITTMQDFLKLNPDGTCEYTIAKMEGTYKITEADGKKKLLMYDKTGAETNSGRYIISVTDKELVINRIMGGSDFEVFKRP